MKHLLLAALLLLSVNTMAQTGKSDYDVSKDKENAAVVFKGQFNFEDLSNEASFGWLKRNSESYKADSNAVKYLKQHLPKYNMVVIMGTWCEDSQNLVPQLYKVLQQTSYPMAQYQMFGVDRAKEAKYIEHRLYKIERVPTIIVFKGHTEIGRITETVKKSIEADLIKIIQPDVEQSK